jgi:hypothetical protein
MPLYFAYGTNMDAEAMRGRCPRSQPLGTARLARHRLAVNDERCFTIVRDPRTEVHGVLFDLALADVPALDRYEEVARGLYAKVMQPVLRAGGSPVRALVYIGRNLGSGPARLDHLDIVRRAATAWALPARYIADLDRFVAPAARPQTRAIGT